MSLAVWGARFFAYSFILVTALYIGYGSVKGTTPDLAIYGGLDWCYNCDSGWNWHVLLMSLAFILFMTEAILLPYHSTGLQGSPIRKWIHMVIMVMGFILAIAGLVSIIQGKALYGTPNMYSVHSWCGAIILVSTFLQALAGSGAFVFFKPMLSEETRKTIGRVHKHVGQLTYFGAIFVVGLGLADQQMMMVDSGQPHYWSATYLQSICGVLLLGLGISIYVIYNLPTPDMLEDAFGSAKSTDGLLVKSAKAADLEAH
jgi:hypothetical protein